MARVLVLSLVFPPDGVSTAGIVGEIALDLRDAGHDVTVITTVPHYNHDPAAEARQPLHRTFGHLTYRSDFRGLTVFHVPVPRKGPRVLPRLAAWTQFHVLSLWVALRRCRAIDVIVVPSPPLTSALIARLLGLVYGAPYLYIVQEIYPDIAIALGALKNRGIIRLLFALERFVYARAGAISVIGERMRDRLLEKGVPPQKVLVIPNFADVDELRPLPRKNAFSSAHGLDSDFVVTYAGNMGPAQRLKTFVDAAALLRDETGLKFLLVGDGGDRERLQGHIANLGLDNVLLLPHQSYELVPQIYATSDLCFVPLAPNAAAGAVPSKVYRIMACGRAILACAEADSDLATVVADARCGMVVEPGAPEAIAAAVRRARRDTAALDAMAESGREYVTANFSRRKIREKYSAVVADLASHESRTGHVLRDQA